MNTPQRIFNPYQSTVMLGRGMLHSLTIGK